ncbi:MAG: ribonuclease R [Vicinamibacteria bacterium]|nr:ribonuclease R [Vicinamibacteria bacterium]
MTELHDRILDRVSHAGKPVALRELAHGLDLRGAALKELKASLRDLLTAGAVIRVRGGRIGLPLRMNLVVGELRCSPSGFGFVVPEAREPDDARATKRRRDVYVSAVNMKEALHGDRVIARIERTTDRGPEGRIIRVLERRLSRLVGRYEEDERHGGHVVPFDRRVLHELIVPPGESGTALTGEMVVAEVTRPPTATRNPFGRVIQVLGRIDEPGVDVKVILAKHGWPETLPEEVETEAARGAREPSPEEIAERTDFRDWTTVTIDPEDARDHDDAVAISRVGSGYRLAVHIADVAHYVPEGGVVDAEAYRRGISVYFPDRVVPMLPHSLSSDVCSLREGRDRLTQSVILEVDETGRVTSAEFHDGVVRSAARLNYEEAQRILDGDTESRARRERLVPMLETMSGLAQRMRARRHERGALDLDLPEPKLLLDQSGEMVGIKGAERLTSMRIVEEFMLAANEAVARHLVESGTPAVFRIHEAPDPEKVEEFCDLVASLGYRLPRREGGATPLDFQAILRRIEHRPEEKLVSYLLLRTMKLARYNEENLGHFGLATERYLHFTSPIRRYPDLIVHRVLRALRRNRSARIDMDRGERLSEMSRHLSERERAASEAERELIEWKKVRFMAGKIGETFSGYVTNVQAFGLFVELEEIYVQGLVHVSSMSDDYYVFQEKNRALRGENTRRVYRLGDRAEVQVARVDLDRRQVDFVLVDVAARAQAGARPGRPPKARRSGPPRRRAR